MRTSTEMPSAQGSATSPPHEDGGDRAFLKLFAVVSALAVVAASIGYFVIRGRIRDAAVEAEWSDLNARQRVAQFAVIDAVERGDLPRQALLTLDSDGTMHVDIDGDGVDRTRVRFDFERDGTKESVTELELRNWIDTLATYPLPGSRQFEALREKALEAPDSGFLEEEFDLLQKVGRGQLPVETLRVLRLEGTPDFDLDRDGKVTDDRGVLMGDLDGDGDREGVSEAELAEALDGSAGS